MKTTFYGAGVLAADAVFGFALFSLSVFAWYLLLSILVLSFAWTFPPWVFAQVFTRIALAGGLGAVTGVATCVWKRLPEVRLGRAAPSPWWDVLRALPSLPGRTWRFLIRRPRWHFVRFGFWVGLLLVLSLPVCALVYGLVLDKVRFAPHPWKVLFFLLDLGLMVGLLLGILAGWARDFCRWLTRSNRGGHLDPPRA